MLLSVTTNRNMSGNNSHLDFDNIVLFLIEHKWIYDFKLTRYVVDRAYAQIPDEWTDVLKNLSLEELSSLPFGTLKDDWPTSFKDFVRKCLAYSISRDLVISLPGKPHDQVISLPGKPHDQTILKLGKPHDQVTSLPGKPHDQVTSFPGKSHDQVTLLPGKPHDQATSLPGKPHDQVTSLPGKPHDQVNLGEKISSTCKNDESKKLTPCSNIPEAILNSEIGRGMSEKKWHEVSHLTRIIDQVTRLANDDVIVDVGSGLGYLGHFLHTMYGHWVLGLEGKSGHSQGANARLKTSDSCHLLRNVTCEIYDNKQSQSEFIHIVLDWFANLSLNLNVCSHFVNQTKNTRSSLRSNHHSLGHSPGVEKLTASNVNLETEKQKSNNVNLGLSPEIEKQTACNVNFGHSPKIENQTACNVNFGHNPEIEKQTACNVNLGHGPEIGAKNESLTTQVDSPPCSTIDSSVQCDNQHDVSGDVSHRDVLGDISHRDMSGNVSYRDMSGNVSHRDMSGNVSHREVSGNVSHRDESGNVSHREVSGNVSHQEVSGNVSHREVSGNVSHRDESGNVSQQISQSCCNLELNNADKSGVRHRSPNVCMVGLHCCGDLTPTMLRYFTQIPWITSLCVVSCCYHRMCIQDESLQHDNFPLSEGLQTALISARKLFPHFKFSPFCLRLAAQETRARWRELTEEDHNLHMRNVAYRALLEYCIENSKGKLTLKKTARRLAHKANFESFSTYIKATYKHVQVQHLGVDEQEVFERDMLKAYAMFEDSFCLIEPLTALQYLLQPVIESLIYTDRQSYLKEYGYHSNIIPIFDEFISPRNLALIAYK